MIHVIVRERDATAQATEPITSGSVGLECSFRFSEDWDGLGKVAIFQGSMQIIDVALVGQESCVVPHEVLQRALGHLKIGVYGTGEQGQRVTPTIWADAGRILPGVEPSEIEPTPATQSLVQQILEAAENAEEIAQSVRDDADAGEFDGADGVSPSISVTDITNGHRVTITDADGTRVFDVMDGEKGDPGESLAYYHATVFSDGTTSLPQDMPTPLELAETYSDGAGLLPVLILHDRGWLYRDTVSFTTTHLDLMYSQYNTSGAKLALFEGTFENRDGSGPWHVWVKGIQNNGRTTWTIGKEALGGGGSEEIFWATYNTTTEAEITAAVTAGKTVLCKISDEIFYLVSKAAIGPSGTAWLFASANQTSMRVTWVSGSYWNSIGTRTIPAAASDIGAIAAPSSPATGAFLVWNGTAWVAQTLATWQGGNY